jgi:hypothetical protein
LLIGAGVAPLLAFPEVLLCAEYSPTQLLLNFGRGEWTVMERG